MSMDDRAITAQYGRPVGNLKDRAIEVGAMALATRFSSGWHMSPSSIIVPTTSQVETARTVVNAIFSELDLTSE